MRVNLEQKQSSIHTVRSFKGTTRLCLLGGALCSVLGVWRMNASPPRAGERWVVKRMAFKASKCRLERDFIYLFFKFSNNLCQDSTEKSLGYFLTLLAFFIEKTHLRRFVGMFRFGDSGPVFLKRTKAGCEYE